MSEVSSGEYRDRITTNSRLVKEQARRPNPRRNSQSGGRIRRAVRRLAIVGALLGTGTAITVAANEFSKPPKESFSTVASDIKYIDTSKYLIVPHIEGQPDLNIRHDSRRITVGENNEIDPAKIATINGVAWDGHSPFLLKNSPIVEDIDPANGILTSPWFALRLGVRDMLGLSVTETIGYINHGEATSAHILRTKDGEIVDASQNSSGQLIGVLDSGKEIPPDRIGLTTVTPGGGITTKVGNPPPTPNS